MVTIALSAVPYPEGAGLPPRTRVQLSVLGIGHEQHREIGVFGPGCPMQSATPQSIVQPRSVLWELRCFYAGSGASLRLRARATRGAIRLILERAPAGEEDRELHYQRLWTVIAPSNAQFSVTASSK
jgi:hypothetical protein